MCRQLNIIKSGVISTDFLFIFFDIVKKIKNTLKDKNIFLDFWNMFFNFVA